MARAKGGEGERSDWGWRGAGLGHKGPVGTRESLKVLGMEVIWSDCALGRAFWLQSRDWIGGCYRLQGVTGDTCKGPREKCEVWNPRSNNRVEKGGGMGASGNGDMTP